ncbi:50S m3Psi1915 methyltransferase [Methylophaga lonarensis MPL]|uniref:Ribosomal RNA large subunit methyltransferase H n=1 Tax=Methylophaga lonarensis MPL TaxID=1286106 RepID=M7P0N1_9GAMM|nr:23S rRNA (pseudouridine(1915)-N(3))-methyltransferase RlmH [Methylophaga lonarensis]EMR13036.1 50S m3Psi1915 methyltransferase [Methylophaga lonarensis MPL]
MKLNILAVGSKMPRWVNEGVEEYSRRLPRDIPLQLSEIPAARRGKTGQPEQWMQEEGQRILTAAGNQHMVALEVTGRSWSTEQLAQQMQQWLAGGKDVCFVIGGPDGLSKACLDRADQSWSLSALTLPHPLVRIVLAEQLYRAWTVLQNHPYHRA